MQVLHLDTFCHLLPGPAKSRCKHVLLPCHLVMNTTCKVIFQVKTRTRKISLVLSSNFNPREFSSIEWHPIQATTRLNLQQTGPSKEDLKWSESRPGRFLRWTRLPFASVLGRVGPGRRWAAKRRFRSSWTSRETSRTRTSSPRCCTCRQRPKASWKGMKN